MTETVESVVENSNSVYGDPAPVQEATAEVQSSIMDLISDTELKEHKSLQNIKDVDSLAKSFIHAQSLVGKRVTEMTAEDMSTYNASLGIPSDVSGYEFDASEQVKMEALELKLNKEQGSKYAELKSREAELADSLKSSTREDKIQQYTKDLEDTYGIELPAKIELARKAAERLGGEDLLKTVFSKDNPANPAFIKALATAGAEFSEHSSVHGSVRKSFSLTSSEAASKILERRADKSFMAKAFDSSVRKENNPAWKELEHLYKLSSKEG